MHRSFAFLSVSSLMLLAFTVAPTTGTTQAYIIPILDKPICDIETGFCVDFSDILPGLPCGDTTTECQQWADQRVDNARDSALGLVEETCNGPATNCIPDPPCRAQPVEECLGTDVPCYPTVSDCAEPPCRAEPIEQCIGTDIPCYPEGTAQCLDGVLPPCPSLGARYQCNVCAPGSTPAGCQERAEQIIGEIFTAACGGPIYQYCLQRYCGSTSATSCVNKAMEMACGTDPIVTCVEEKCGSVCDNPCVQEIVECLVGDNCTQIDLERCISDNCGSPCDLIFEQWYHDSFYPRLNNGDTVTIVHHDCTNPYWPSTYWETCEDRDVVTVGYRPTVTQNSDGTVTVTEGHTGITITTPHPCGSPTELCSLPNATVYTVPNPNGDGTDVYATTCMPNDTCTNRYVTTIPDDAPCEQLSLCAAPSVTPRVEEHANGSRTVTVNFCNPAGYCNDVRSVWVPNPTNHTVEGNSTGFETPEQIVISPVHETDPVTTPYIPSQHVEIPGYWTEPLPVGQVCAPAGLICIGPFTLPPMGTDPITVTDVPEQNETTVVESQDVPPEHSEDVPVFTSLTVGYGPVHYAVEPHVGETRPEGPFETVIDTPIVDIPVIVCAQTCAVPVGPGLTAWVTVWVEIQYQNETIHREESVRIG